MVSLLVAIIVLLLPGIATLELTGRVIVAAVILLLPIVGLLCWHWLCKIAVSMRRSRCFPTLVARLSSAQQAVAGIAQQTMYERNVYEIEHCYIAPAGYAVLAIRKKRNLKIQPATAVIVVDTDTQSITGNFSVLRQDKQLYICRQNGYVEPVWLGLIKKNGIQLSPASPTAVALLISSTKGDEND